MTIRHLTIFCAVYENESITAAAEQLHMTQPTVTRAIQELEDYYRISLFERVHHRLYVTEAGRRLYRQAYHVVSLMDQMKTDMSEWGESGVINIGAGTTLGSTLLPNVLKEFSARHPRLQLHVTVSDCSKLEELLLHNRLDVALMESGEIDESLQKAALEEDNLLLILPNNHPLLEKKRITVPDIAKEPVLTLSEGSANYHFVQALLSHASMPFSPMMESDNVLSVLQAVHAGLGIALLPEKLVEDALHTGFVAGRTIDDVCLSRPNYVVWHRHRFVSNALRDFIDLCGKAQKTSGV